jgi:type IV pilus assembly protein PilA
MGRTSTTHQEEEGSIMMRKIRNRKGFTLVELMIVVAIIGILAAIAIPNFLNFRLKAKTSEAKSNLGAIRSTEVAYYAEWNSYVANQAQTPGVPDAQKHAWVGGTRFSILGFAPEGNVYFSYSLTPGTDYPTNGFTAHAYGDLDGDAVTSDFYIVSSGTEIQKTGAPF